MEGKSIRSLGENVERAVSLDASSRVLTGQTSAQMGNTGQGQHPIRRPGRKEQEKEEKKRKEWAGERRRRSRRGVCVCCARRWNNRRKQRDLFCWVGRNLKHAHGARQLLKRPNTDTVCVLIVCPVASRCHKTSAGPCRLTSWVEAKPY